MAVSELNLGPIECTVCVSRDAYSVIPFTIKNPVTGRPIDISADDIKFTVKDSYEGAVEISTVTSSAGAHADGPNGRVEFEIPAGDTSGASVKLVTCWVYEVTRCINEDPAEEVVVYRGLFKVQPRVGQG